MILILILLIYNSKQVHMDLNTLFFVHLFILKLFSNLYGEMFLEYGDKLKIKLFYETYFLKFLLTMVYPFFHFLMIFQKIIPMFKCINCLIFILKLVTLLFLIHSYFQTLNIFETFLSNEVKMKCKYLVKFLRLKENKRNSDLSFLEK